MKERSDIMAQTAAKLFFSILPIGFFVWTIKAMIRKIDDYPNTLDANQDGFFTISDLPKIFKDLTLAVGDEYQALFADTKIGVFLEMDTNDPNIYWSIALAVFVYFIIFSLFQVWTFSFED